MLWTFYRLKKQEISQHYLFDEDLHVFDKGSVLSEDLHIFGNGSALPKDLHIFGKGQHYLKTSTSSQGSTNHLKTFTSLQKMSQPPEDLQENKSLQHHLLDQLEEVLQ